MLEFYRSIWSVAWSIIDIHIPITSSASITPWQIALFGLVLGLLIKQLFNKGSEG